MLAGATDAANNNTNNGGQAAVLAAAAAPAPTTGVKMGTLVLVEASSGPERGPCPTSVEVAQSPFVIGRYPDSQLHLTNPCISGRHCVITRSVWPASQLATCTNGAGRGFDTVLADTSTNGCYVNGQRVGRGQTATLQDGDEVQLVVASQKHEHARYNLTYRFSYPALPSPPRPAPPTAPLPHQAAAAAVIEGPASQSPTPAAQRPLETAAANASQYDVAACMHQSDIESDDAPGEGSSVLDLRGESRPVRRVSSVKRRSVTETYDLDFSNPLGSGAFATVYRGTHRRTGRVVAVKQINKRRLALQHAGGDGAAIEQPDAKLKMKLEKEGVRQQREVEILLSVRHPHVVRCYGVYETPEYLWFVLSFAAGGELFAMLKTLGTAPEALARRVTAQLVSAVHYLHSVGVVHRDIKLENLLLHRPIGAMPSDPNSQEFADWLDSIHILVSDFGLSRVLSSDTSVMSTMCGTPVYAAPEVTDRRLRVGGPEGYTPAVDLFSVGVVAYALLTGRPPYPYSRDAQGRTIKGRIDYNAGVKWPTPAPIGTGPRVSAEARHCIEGLLQVLPSRRLSAADSLAHPWMVGGTLAHHVAADGAVGAAGMPGGKRGREPLALGPSAGVSGTSPKNRAADSAPPQPR